MPSAITEWPAWIEHTKADPKHAQDPVYLSAKRAVLAEYGAEALQKSWLAVCAQLEAVTADIAVRGSSAIPVHEAADVVGPDGLSAAAQAEIKKRGCVVIRQVLPRSEAEQLYADLQTYVADNRDVIRGWPADSPSMLILYDSPTQNAIRGHPNQLQVQRQLNGFWHDDNNTEADPTSSEPLIFFDGVRDRPSRQEFIGLGPHIDAGSLSRWADPAYRHSYANVFNGSPERHDCYDLGVRKQAQQALFPATAHSTVFRSFQGWTALTPTGPRAGTMLLYPDVQSAIAYVLLRPFFRPPADPSQIMDASKWTIVDPTDQDGWFPGTNKNNSQMLSRSSHPHLRLEDCLVHVPALQPGDTVWWHTDVCHAVEPEHIGPTNASVVYVPACPTTAINKAYVKRQLAATTNGQVPPDYMRGNDLDETKLKGYVGHGGLSEEAKAAFGYYL
ncbi:duf1479 domain containing protein [Grosmannia clavigera kw1407]|uniref:Duf1479 domain containing protein n=1 Tax=Grosmannia clavigera (strain kw1407 / UAMH 11150) TaxID=655863 RepID=F0XBJ3_GROCL|nr:duf1479 domain containing protein [Grosmannia clavigera kw1407]EFX04933.1 duf1479 domain containing protein [Grosmannia clavigera kw1407]